MSAMFGGDAKKQAEQQQRMAIAQTARQTAQADQALAAARGSGARGSRLLRFLSPDQGNQATLG